MKRKRIRFGLATIILIMLILFGRRLLFFILFSLNGTSVTSFTYGGNMEICINIEVNKDEKIYKLSLYNIQLSNFYSNKIIHIRSINGNSLVQYGCNSSDKSVYSNITKKYVPYQWSSTGLTLGSNSIVSNYFGYKFETIFEYINVVDSINLKLNSIPNDKFEYWSDNSNDEVYVRRFSYKQRNNLRDFDNIKFEFKNCK
jgi:hypothetical protein